MEHKYFLQRIEKLRAFIKNSDEALLITNEINVGYFSGFQHSEGVFLVTLQGCFLLVDFRYYEAAIKKAENCKVICFKNLMKEISEILKDESIKTVYFEASDLSVLRFSNFSKAFKKMGVECCADNRLDEKISEIRIIKDETEFEKILTAQKIAEKAYLEVLNYIKPGVTERKIATELEYLMKKRGAEHVSFDLITITGKKTSLPHGVPDDSAIQKGDFFTMDFGAVYDGYHSDTTRTVAVGSVSDEQCEIYNIVLKAQQAVLEKVKEGILCSDADKIARDIISDAGYGEFFGHSTGHGVGLNIHEAPVVSPKSTLVLKEGMVITDEPGIYLPEKFGVRIEDMLYVTKNGFKNFVSLPKELLIV